MGSWKNTKEMEETLTLAELYALINHKREEEYARNKFMAALKGVDLDEGKSDERFESIQRRAAADLANKSEEEYVFDMIGFEVEADDE